MNSSSGTEQETPPIADSSVLLKENASEDKMEIKYEFEQELNIPNGWGKRHGQYFLWAVTYGIVFIIKTNLNVTIVSMTDPRHNNTAEIFEWNKQTQNTILSMFFFGFFIMMIPSGILIQRYGAKVPCAASLGISSLALFTFPWLTKLGGYYFAAASRFIQGLAVSAILPSLHHMVGKWAPLSEKGRATAYIHIGSKVGSIVTLGVCGYLTVTPIGWPLVFYVSGLCLFIGCILMLYFGVETPSQHSTITEEELNYIKRMINGGKSSSLSESRPPWKSIFTSVPFLVIALSAAGYLWCFGIASFEVPSYLNSILGISIQKNGVLNAILNLGNCVLSFVLSNVMDYLIKRRKVSVTAARKISNSIGMWLSSVLLFIFTFIPPSNLILAITVLVLAEVGFGGVNSGQLVTVTDIAPNYSGLTMAIMGAFGNIFAALSPVVNGAIISDVHNVVHFRYAFGLAASLAVITNLLYVLFGTSEIQPWNNQPSSPEADTENRQNTKKI